jgi:hypothetical protein
LNKVPKEKFLIGHSANYCFFRIEFYNERGVKRTATYLPEVAPEQGAASTFEANLTNDCDTHFV